MGLWYKQENGMLDYPKWDLKGKINWIYACDQWSSHVQAKESDCGGDELYGVYNPSAYRNIYS